nr:hypothetical protein B0A51_18741 [Rachicladosporium sp. CCFEE 5018]
MGQRSLFGLSEASRAFHQPTEVSLLHHRKLLGDAKRLWPSPSAIEVMHTVAGDGAILLDGTSDAS